jgi:cytochrome b561
MDKARYDRVSILIHWTAALLVGLLFATVWARERAPESAQALLAAHRACGLLVWLLTLARLLWRRGHPAPEAALAPPHRLAARSSQALLIALLVVQPATGLAQSLLRGRAFSIGVAAIPALLPKNKAAMALFHKLHELGAWTLAGIVGVHAAAALVHHFILRDEVLRAMLPAAPRRVAAQLLLPPAETTRE